MIFQSTKRLFSSLIVFNIIALSLYAGLLWFIRHEDNQASALREEIIELAKKDKGFSSVNAIMQDTAKKRVILDSFFVRHENLITFLDMVNMLGKDAGIDLDVKKVDLVGDTASSSSVETLKLDLSGEGSWKGMYHFLSLFESLPYEVSFDQVRLHAVEKETASERKVKKYVWEGTFVARFLKIREGVPVPK